MQAEIGQEIDPLVALARKTVEEFILEGKTTPTSADLGPCAGTFVSLYKGEDLRGCIGTTQPTKPTLAEEIESNAVAACTYDPRFEPVRPEELDYLSYSVDVLTPPESIDDISQLDPKRYGVVVSFAKRRGVLLPDLEGVDTVDRQIEIAMRKGGIPAGAPEMKIERFEVIRHNKGGEARKTK